VRAVLRTWFTQWGLPAQLRLDNGPPWGSSHDLPPDLALWLLGLGIALVWNRPRHSQGNAVIERAHGVCQRWVEPGACGSPAEVQARLDRFTTVQRERYPAIAGQSRLAAYPALAASGRPYDPGQEGLLWSVRRVWAALGERVWTRRVDKVGRISLANRPIGVGRPWVGQTVTVRLAVAANRPVWQIRDGQGTLLIQQPAPEFSRARIRALAVSHRGPSRRSAAKPRAPQGANLTRANTCIAPTAVAALERPPKIPVQLHSFSRSIRPSRTRPARRPRVRRRCPIAMGSSSARSHRGDTSPYRRHSPARCSGECRRPRSPRSSHCSNRRSYSPNRNTAHRHRQN